MMACTCGLPLQVGVAVFHVLSCREEELMQSACAAEAEPGLTTRLVIPDDAISSSMSRCACMYEDV